MESDDIKSVKWKDCQTPRCLAFIEKCRMGIAVYEEYEEKLEEKLEKKLEEKKAAEKAKEAARAARRAKALEAKKEKSREYARKQNGRKVVSKCEEIGFHLTDDQKASLLGGERMRDLLSKEDMKTYKSMCYKAKK